MLKKGPLWAIYTASYFIDYILILGILVWKKKQDVPKWNQFIPKCTLSDWLIWALLLILIIISVLVMIRIQRIKMTARVKYDPKDDAVWETYTAFLAPALALGGTFVDEFGLVLSLVVFVAAGIAFVRSKQVHLASVFIFPLCYNIFKSENVVLITRDSRDELRIRIEEEPDGVEAKELAPKIYLIK